MADWKTDQETIRVLLADSTSPDQTTRENSERVLTQTASSSPSAMVNTLLLILADASTAQATKKTVCVWLQKMLSSYNSLSSDLWAKLDEETRSNFKKSIFQALHSEGSEEVRKQIADTIGEVGGSLWSSKAVADACALPNSALWPDLVDTVLKIFTQDNDKSLLDCLNICAALFPYVSDFLTTHLEKISSLVKKGIESQSGEIKVSTIEVIGTLVSNLPAKEGKRYFKFAPQVIKLLNEMFFGTDRKTDLGEKALGIISEVVEEDPEMFRGEFLSILQLLGKVRSTAESSQTAKDLSVEIAVSIAIKYPVLVKKHQGVLPQIIDLLFDHMLEIPDEFSADWFDPPKGYDDKKTDAEGQRIVEFAKERFDALCGNIGASLVLRHLTLKTEALFERRAWKPSFVSFMAWSQVGEHLDSLDQIAKIRLRIVEHLRDGDARVRYAALHCLGFIAHDFSPDLQDNFFEELLPLILKAVNDEVPRVVSEACLCAGDFFEGCEEEYLKPYFDPLFARLIGLVHAEPSFVHENALSALWNLCDTAPKLFAPHLEQTVELLVQKLREATDPRLKKYRGNLIEAITSICLKGDPKKVLPFAEAIVELIVKVQETFLEEGEDSQKNFILLAWPKVSEALKENFARFIPLHFESIFKVCLSTGLRLAAITKKKVAGQPAESLSKDELAFVHDECSSAVNLLTSLVEDHPQSMACFVPRIKEFVMPYLDFEDEEDVRTSAAECLAVLILAVKAAESVSKEQVQTFAQDLITSFWASIEKESEIPTLGKKVEALAEVLQSSGVHLSLGQMEGFYKRCMTLIKSSVERTEEAEAEVEEMESDDESDGLPKYESKAETEHQLQCSIADLIGHLLKSQGKSSLPIYESVHSSLITASLVEHRSPQTKKLGLYLICDCVDAIGEFLPQERILLYYKQYLRKYIAHTEAFLRQPAAYCLGSVAGVLKEHWLTYLQESLMLLKKSHHFDILDQDEESFNLARDNAVSAVGKSLKATWSVIEPMIKPKYLNEWLGNLPLEFDHIEAHFCHEFLMDLLDQNQSLVFNKNENIIMVLKIFTAIYEQESSNAALDARIRSKVQQLKSSGLVTPEVLQKVSKQVNDLWNELSAES